MNKIYKTIWNKARRCLCVVSELAKSHSGTGTVVKAAAKKTFLLMSFAAMLAPQVMAPSYATDYYVGAGSSTNGFPLNAAGDRQIVLAGGKTEFTGVNVDGASQIVSSGGSSYHTVIRAGSQTIYAGGKDSLTDVSATQYVYGETDNTTVSAGGIQNVWAGGSARTVTVKTGGHQMISGGTANGIFISGGLQTISSGRASSTKIVGGKQYIRQGGIASDTQVMVTGQVQPAGQNSTSAMAVLPFQQPSIPLDTNMFPTAVPQLPPPSIVEGFSMFIMAALQAVQV